MLEHQLHYGNDSIQGGIVKKNFSVLIKHAKDDNFIFFLNLFFPPPFLMPSKQTSIAAAIITANELSTCRYVAAWHFPNICVTINLLLGMQLSVCNVVNNRHNIIKLQLNEGGWSTH